MSILAKNYLAQVSVARAGNTNCAGRLSTDELLTEVAHFVKSE
jgi:hypothetical protein